MDKENVVCIYMHVCMCVCVYIYIYIMEYYSDIKKETLLFATTWMDIESIMLHKKSQRKTNSGWSHLFAESKDIELVETESRMEAASGEGWGKWGNICQRVQTSSYKMNKFWGF